MWTRAKIGQTWVMNFNVEAWEVPPGADANNLSVPIEFGPVEWNGAQTRISVRRLQLEAGAALAFFRPHNGQMNYVVTHGNDAPVPVTEKHGNSKTLGLIVRAALYGEQAHFGRLFYCHGERLIFREERSYWESPDFWQREHPIVIPFDMRTEPSRQVFDWLQTQWNDTDSDLRIAWEWNRKSEPEQNLWLGTIVLRWNELHDLMRAVACVAELPTGTRWMLVHIDTHNHSPELLARLQPWRELLQAHFSFEPLPNSYPEFLREYFQMASSHVQVEGAEVSAHQQLEAKLYLRDWLQRHAPEHLHLIQ